MPRFKPVDATHWLNRSAGVSMFSVFLGCSLRRLVLAFSLACETSNRSIHFGKYCLNRPLVLSLEPRCQGLCGSQKYTLMSVAYVKHLWSAIAAHQVESQHNIVVTL